MTLPQTSAAEPGFSSWVLSCGVEAWGEMADAWTLVAAWQRPYSEIMRLRLRIGSTTRDVLCKRARWQTGSGSGGEAVWTDFEKPDTEPPALREFQALRSAAATLAATPDCRVPQAYSVEPTAGLLFMEWITGYELDRDFAAAQWMTRSLKRREVASSYTRLGRWLHGFQQSPQGSLEPSDWGNGLHRQAETRMRWIERDDRVPKHLRRHVLARLERCLVTVRSPLRATPCHGDFGPWNALVTDQGLTVIDFACYRSDSRWWDVASVMTYLNLQRVSPRFRAACLDTWRIAFGQGFGEPIEPDAEYTACEILQWLIRLQDALEAPRQTWLARWQRPRTIAQIVRHLQGP